jgi:hypothetical protein
MFATPNVFDFLVHEFSRLCAGSFTLARGLSCFFDGLLFGHGDSLQDGFVDDQSLSGGPKLTCLPRPFQRRVRFDVGICS